MVVRCRRRGVDPVDLAVLTAVTAVVALGAHAAALLPPARTGVPGRATALLLELATAGAGASALALWLRRDDWTSIAAVAALATLFAASGVATRP